MTNNLKTIEELSKMTIKELRDYLMISINDYVKQNWFKSELILTIVNLVGVKQN